MRIKQQCSKADDVLLRLRNEHLNAEDRANFEHLCAWYADVFYTKGEALMFTNKIKHQIRKTKYKNILYKDRESKIE